MSEPELQASDTIEKEESIEQNLTAPPEAKKQSSLRHRLAVVFLTVFCLVVASYYGYQWLNAPPYPEMGQYEEWGEISVRLAGAKLEKADMVVVLLHGARGNAFGMLNLARRISPNDNTSLVLANGPVVIGGDQLAWFGRETNFEATKSKMISVLKHVQEKNPQAKIVLGGFSQGAILSSNFLELDSELVDGLVLFSPSGWLRHPLTGKLERKPNVFFAHGRNDRILAFERAEKLYHRLGELNYQVDWCPYDDGHVVAPEVVQRAKSFLTKIIGE